METIETDEWGSKFHYKNGERHRGGNLPAIEYPDGEKHYYKNGERHRDGDLPAIEYADGTSRYFRNGKRHRDGELPAIEWSDGDKSYYKNGIRYTKEQVEFMTRMEKKKLIKVFRYWYDKTYSDPNGKAFIAMMMRDMYVLEKEIGYRLD